jgi:ketosteroid isomerase-like protein
MLGCATAVAVLLVSRALPAPRLERGVLALFLALMPAVYLAGWGLTEHGPRVWIEIAGLAIFVTLAILGLLISPWYLALGIIAHGALWDAWHHERIVAQQFIPSWYTIACLIADVGVGVYACRRIREWNMTRLIGLLIVAALGTAASARAQSGADEQLAVAEAYLKARAATMQAGSTAADVDRVLSLCAPSVVYEHPRAKMVLSGVETLRSGMRGFLGSARMGAITVTQTLRGRDMAAIQTTVRFEARDGESWLPVARSQTWVFEFDGGRISRIIEYW